jgi:hypothetical protein
VVTTYEEQGKDDHFYAELKDSVNTYFWDNKVQSLPCKFQTIPENRCDNRCDNKGEPELLAEVFAAFKFRIGNIC